MAIPILSLFSLHFCLALDNDTKIENGRLTLVSSTHDGEGNHLGQCHEVWVATSSHSRGQKPENFNVKGGVIPPEYRVPGLKSWTVLTDPIPMPNNPGVRGNFYKINPHTVRTTEKVERGDFGIHLDANVPGSMGCIVMDKTRFASFEKWMTRLREDYHIKSLPLHVAYPTD